MQMHRSLFRAGTRHPFYFGALGFFAGLMSMASTINSNVIVLRLGESFITPLYLMGALLAATLFLAAPSFLSRIGNRGFFVAACLAEGGAMIALAIGDPVASAVALILTSASYGLIWFSLDIFLEDSMCREEETGTARGIYLTFQNIAYAAAPLAAGAVAGLAGYSPVYSLNAFIVAFLMFFAFPIFKTFKDPAYPSATVADMVRGAVHNSAVRRAAAANLMLRFYYAVYFIYVPLLLFLSYGFSWPVIGLMLAVSTLPYALFELPLGRLADRARDERRILIAGFLLLAAATAALALPLPHDLGLITTILFLQGVGAAAVEIMIETHFFRAVGPEHLGPIALFRLVQPLGLIIAAATGGLVLAFLPLHSAFGIYGALILFGIVPALEMRRGGRVTAQGALAEPPATIV